MLGHYSVQQTEEYAITEQEAIGREMRKLQKRLNTKENISITDMETMILKLQKELEVLKNLKRQTSNKTIFERFDLLDKNLQQLTSKL